MRLDAYTQKRIENEGYEFHSRHIMKSLAWEEADKQQGRGYYTMIAYDYDSSEHLLFVAPRPMQTR